MYLSSSFLDIVAQVKANKDPPFRPNVPDPAVNESDELQLLVKEMRKCWDQTPNRRPNFDTLRTVLKPKGEATQFMSLSCLTTISSLE